jgi:hypothetical protein
VQRRSGSFDSTILEAAVGGLFDFVQSVCYDQTNETDTTNVGINIAVGRVTLGYDIQPESECKSEDVVYTVLCTQVLHLSPGGPDRNLISVVQSNFYRSVAASPGVTM